MGIVILEFLAAIVTIRWIETRPSVLSAIRRRCNSKTDGTTIDYFIGSS
jgi:hypothetical protein